jgi:hypothetical protein
MLAIPPDTSNRRRSSNRSRAVFFLLTLSHVALLAWLFGGIYREREFGDYHLFLKARPTARFYFTAPAGEADDEDIHLTPEEWSAEHAYQEQVEAQGGYRRSLPLPW